MKILTNTLEFSPSGGVELHAFQMSRELASRGHVIDVVAQRDGVLRDEFRSFSRTATVGGDFLHTAISWKQLRHPVVLGAWTNRIARVIWNSWKLRPDIIYANDQQALIWACAVSHLPEIPIVCHLHGRAAWPLGRQRSLLARRVASFVAPSGFIRDDWIRFGMPPDRIRVIPQAISPEAFPPSTEESRHFARRALDVPDGAFLALYLGRIVPDKGIDVLLRAWNSLMLPPEQGRLLVVGPAWPWSYLQKLRSMAEPGCRFMDIQENVLPLLHAADVLVVPSTCPEAFGRVIIEAMATGCPVLASNLGGIPEVLTGPFASMMFEPGNAEQLATHLRGIRPWRQDRPDLAEACTAHVAQRFHLTDIADEVEELLQGATVRHWRTTLA